MQQKGNKYKSKNTRDKEEAEGEENEWNGRAH